MTSLLVPCTITAARIVRAVVSILAVQGGGSMMTSNALLLAAVLIGQSPDVSKLAEAAVVDLQSVEAPQTPRIAFEIHDLTATSPDWRGRLLPKLQPVAREDSVAVWTIDSDALSELTSDPQLTIVQTPRMLAQLGEPVRMSNEEEASYIAHIDRMSDGPPNQGTRLAFQPIVDEIHDGVRVEVERSRLEGSDLFAHLRIRQNKLIGFLTTQYAESVTDSNVDSEVVRTSLLSKLRSEAGDKSTIRATLQIPDVSTRRIEGDWKIPTTGGLLVSLGPLSSPTKNGRRQFEERLIVITAKLETTPSP